MNNFLGQSHISNEQTIFSKQVRNCVRKIIFSKTGGKFLKNYPARRAADQAGRGGAAATAAAAAVCCSMTILYIYIYIIYFCLVPL